nr:MAG TPA: hypothetical protein [Caudoviricetes sp.]
MMLYLAYIKYVISPLLCAVKLKYNQVNYI